MRIFRGILIIFVGIMFIGSDVLSAKKRMPVTEISVKQKANVVIKLLTKSVIVKSIKNSSNNEAKATLKKARSLLGEANADLGAGNFAKADKTLNRSINLITMTARQVVTKEDRRSRMKKRYTARRDAVRAILQAYDRVAKEKGLTTGQEIRDEVVQNLNKGEELFRQNKLTEAIEVTNGTYLLATQITRKLRQGDVLVRRLSFKNKEEEYVYEIDRNDSHFLFLKMALKRKAPHPMYLKKIEKLRDLAQALREDAETKAGKNRHEEAISVLGDGTKHLIRAIRMAGIFIPG